MALTTSSLTRADIAKLEVAYDFVNREDVLDYLDRHISLIPILFEASQAIPRYFVLDRPLALELLIGPEDIEDQSLFVVIRTGLTSSEALDRLDRLDAEWWIKRSHQTDGDMTITIQHW